MMPDSTRLAHCVLDSIRVVRNDRQEDARWSVRLRSALFPVLDRRWREPEPRCEFRLTQAKLLAKSSNVDDGSALDANHGDSHRNVLAAGPGDRLLYAANESAASSRVFLCRTAAPRARH